MGDDQREPVTVRPETMARALRSAAASRPLWIEVAGRSMGRTIVPPARVLVSAAVRPRRGEVWAYCDDRSVVVVHRFLRRRGDALIFQGDGAARPDAPVHGGRLVGKVVAVDRGGRRLRMGQLSRLAGWAQRALWGALWRLRRGGGP